MVNFTNKVTSKAFFTARSHNYKRNKCAYNTPQATARSSRDYVLNTLSLFVLLAQMNLQYANKNLGP